MGATGILGYPVAPFISRHFSSSGYRWKCLRVEASFSKSARVERPEVAEAVMKNRIEEQTMIKSLFLFAIC